MVKYTTRAVVSSGAADEDSKPFQDSLHPMSATHLHRGLLMDTMRQDVRFGLRQLRRTPMVSLVIVATLAVCIGAAAAIFSAVDTMLFRQIYRDEHELVKL